MQPVWALSAELQAQLGESALSGLARVKVKGQTRAGEPGSDPVCSSRQWDPGDCAISALGLLVMSVIVPCVSADENALRVTKPGFSGGHQTVRRATLEEGSGKQIRSHTVGVGSVFPGGRGWGG